MTRKPDVAPETTVPAPSPPPVDTGPPPTVVSAETRARIVDLCNHAVRVDAGGTGKLAQQILADLGA